MSDKDVKCSDSARATTCQVTYWSTYRGRTTHLFPPKLGSLEKLSSYEVCQVTYWFTNV